MGVGEIPLERAAGATTAAADLGLVDRCRRGDPRAFARLVGGVGLVGPPGHHTYAGRLASCPIATARA